MHISWPTTLCIPKLSPHIPGILQNISLKLSYFNRYIDLLNSLHALTSRQNYWLVHLILLITGKETSDLFNSSCWLQVKKQVTCLLHPVDYRSRNKWLVHFILLITGQELSDLFTSFCWLQVNKQVNCSLHPVDYRSRIRWLVHLILLISGQELSDLFTSSCWLQVNKQVTCSLHPVN